MVKVVNRVDRIPTGIPGFDKLVEGGFVKNSVNLISGGAGTGKSIFAMQFILNGILKYNEPGLFISFEEKIENLKEDALVFGWDFNKLEKEGKCKFLYVGPYNSVDIVNILTKEISQFKPKRVVIDSLSILAMALKDGFNSRKHLFEIASLLQYLNCTSILTSEISGEAPLDVSSSGSSLSRGGVEEFIADSVITLHNTGLGGEGDRAIRVVKMRRTNHVKSPMPMKISVQGMDVQSKKGY